jgi:hypothetical protein
MRVFEMWIRLKLEIESVVNERIEDIWMIPWLGAIDFLL